MVYAACCAGHECDVGSREMFFRDMNLYFHSTPDETGRVVEMAESGRSRSVAGGVPDFLVWREPVDGEESKHLIRALIGARPKADEVDHTGRHEYSWEVSV
jgi:hypothetical protein